MSRRGWSAAVVTAVVALTAISGAPAAVASSENRTIVIRNRVAGQVAQAVWTTCGSAAVGQLCTETVALAANAKSRSEDFRDRTPVLQVFTFVYRVVEGDDGEPSTLLVAEWFGRLEGADVQGRPRLQRTVASGRLPVQVCNVDPEAGLSCPAVLDVSIVWVGQGPLERIAEHVVSHEQFRIVNSWTRGWHRAATATATINGASPGTQLSADLFRIDQGEVIVQHSVE